MDEFFKIVVSNITVGGLVIFIGRLILKKTFDAGIIKYQNRLELMKMEHQVKYSKLHEERAEFLKELYSELVELETRLLHLTSPAQGSEWTIDHERRDAANSQLEKCTAKIEVNRIFLTDQFCLELLNNLNGCSVVITEMEKAKGQYDGFLRMSMEGRGSSLSPIQIWENQHAKVKGDIKQQRIEIASRFRELLGVS